MWLVTASENHSARTEFLLEIVARCGLAFSCRQSDQSYLESYTIQGDSPVDVSGMMSKKE